MADMNKAEKLAAARKKLKEFQQKPKEPSSLAPKVKNLGRSNDERNNGSHDIRSAQNNTPYSEHREVIESRTFSNNSPFGNGTTGENPLLNIVDNKASFTNSGSEYNRTTLAASFADACTTNANLFFDHLPTQQAQCVPSSDVRGMSSTDDDAVSQSSDQAATVGLVEYLPGQPVNDQVVSPPSEQYSEDRQLPTVYDQFVTTQIEQSLLPVTPMFVAQQSYASDSPFDTNSPTLHSTYADPFSEVTTSNQSNPRRFSSEYSHTAAQSPVLLSNSDEDCHVTSVDRSASPVQSAVELLVRPNTPGNDEIVATLASEVLLHQEAPTRTDEAGSSPRSTSDILHQPLASEVLLRQEAGTSSLLTSDILHQPLASEVLLCHEAGSSPRSTSDILHQPLASEVLLHHEARTSPRSTSENLRQLSMAVNGLIGPQTPTHHGGETNQLECRNQELAALLETECQRTEQLQLQLQEYQAQTSQLSAQLSAARLSAVSESQSELSAMQEQLQLRVQTIGILVAEKTELQAALNQCQVGARNKVAETEELQARLKASRHRKTDLEKEAAVARIAMQQAESSRVAAVTELESLRVESRQLTSHLRELRDEKDESDHRLASKTAECAQLAEQLYETKTQLSLAQLRVTQLGSDDTPDDTAHLEAMHKEKLHLEEQVKALELSVKALSSERDATSQHYQQYVSTLDAQLHSLTGRVDTAAAENLRLLQREDSLVQHVAYLEKRLQEQSQPKAELSATPTPDVTDLETRLKDMEEEKSALKKLFEERSEVASSAERTMIEQEARIEELEAMLDRMQGDQPDQVRLLATMESDKVAAARAVTQNQRLKRELLELQNGFIDVSNAKLDLTDKLEHERHVGKELMQRLAEMQTQFDKLKSHATEHDDGHGHGHGHAHGHGHSHQHQDEHSQIAGILHRELAQSKERIEALSIQNIELKTLLAQKTTSDRPESDKDEQIASLTMRLQQLEDKMNESVSTTDGSMMTSQAMVQLQDRFTSTMAEVAELTDEKQRLEHLVLQLQGETETIGEYITLYQKQRSLLRERVEEKDSELRCVTQDREELQSKLSQLNELVLRLVAEKGIEQLSDGELRQIRQQAADHETSEENVDTADEIMALLSEIGSNSLVDPEKLCEHVYPCPCCSGRLITV